MRRILKLPVRAELGQRQDVVIVIELRAGPMDGPVGGMGGMRR